MHQKIQKTYKIPTLCYFQCGAVLYGSKECNVNTTHFLWYWPEWTMFKMYTCDVAKSKRTVFNYSEAGDLMSDWMNPLFTSLIMCSLLNHFICLSGFHTEKFKKRPFNEYEQLYVIICWENSTKTKNNMMHKGIRLFRLK